MSRYYDDYISHSSGPWKEHKYLNKIGNGPNAKYVYAGGINKSTDENGNAIKQMHQKSDDFGRRIYAAERNYAYTHGDADQRQEQFFYDAKRADRAAKRYYQKKKVKRVADSIDDTYKKVKKSKIGKTAKRLGKNVESGIKNGALSIGSGIVAAGGLAGSTANKVNKFLSKTGAAKSARKQLHKMQSDAKKQVNKTNKAVKKQAAKTANKAGKNYVAYNHKRAKKIANRVQTHSQKMTTELYGPSKKRKR